MARRRSNNFTTDLPRAFSGYGEHGVLNAINKMALEQRHMATRHITVEDMRQMFVPEHLRHSLKEAYSVAYSAAYQQEMVLNVPLDPLKYNAPANTPLLATFRWDRTSCPEGFFVPQPKFGGLMPTGQPDAPDWLREKFQYMFEQLARIAFEFGLVKHVFAQLNVNGYCNTPAQMRYVWPAIKHIVDKAGQRDLARDIAESSARAGDKARVPVHISDFMVETMNIVNRTILMDKIDTDERREFSLRMGQTNFIVGNPAQQFHSMA